MCILIIEEFDILANSNQGRNLQPHNILGILYRLFEKCAAKPLVVIAMSTRWDAIDLLEKRVKSRFSLKQLLYMGMSTDQMFSSLKERLSITDKTITNEPLCTKFLHSIENILCDSDVKRELSRIWENAKDFRIILNIVSLALNRIDETIMELVPHHIVAATASLLADEKSLLLKALSFLELCLLVALKHLHEKKSTPCSFIKVYKEYKEFASQHSPATLYTKAVSLKAFEHLLELELVRSDIDNPTTPKEFKLVQLLVDPKQIEEILLTHSECTTILKQWGCKWIE